MSAIRNPIQPLVVDDRGVERFKANAMVRHLLDNGGITLNHLAMVDFSDDDRRQFAQLIGYSWSGAADLSYMDAVTLDSAREMKDRGISEVEARLECCEETLRLLRATLREPIAALYEIHPDDLSSTP